VNNYGNNVPLNSAESRPRIIGIAFRIIISVAALYWIISRIEWSGFARSFESIRFLPFISAFFIFSSWIFFCSLRWVEVTRCCGYPISLKETIIHYIIGIFFNAFLPTGKGGDVVRGILIAKRYRISTAGILGTILVERFIGFLVSIFIIMAITFATVTRFDQARNVLFSTLLLGLVLLGGLFFLYAPFFREIIRKIMEKLGAGRLIKAAGEISQVLDECRRHPGILARIVGLSFLNQFVNIISAVVLAAALPGFAPPWFSFPIVIPLIFIAQLLPSVGGLGIREAGFVVFFGWFGVAGEAAALYAVLRLSFNLVLSLLGGIIYLSRKRIVTAE